MSQNDRELSEFFRSCAKFILGESTGVRLKALPETRDALREALLASRDLYIALEDGRSLEEVRATLDRKSAAAARFKSATGITWRI